MSTKFWMIVGFIFYNIASHALAILITIFWGSGAAFIIVCVIMLPLHIIEIKEVVMVVAYE